MPKPSKKTLPVAQSPRRLRKVKNEEIDISSDDDYVEMTTIAKSPKRKQNQSKNAVIEITDHSHSKKPSSKSKNKSRKDNSFEILNPQTSSKKLKTPKKLDPETNLPLFEFIDQKNPQKSLDEKTIVLSGVFNNFENREHLILILKNFGAKVTGSISGKTDLLIHGHVLEDGRPVNQGNKYKNALSKSVPILSEQEFKDLFTAQFKINPYSYSNASAVSPLKSLTAEKKAQTLSGTLWVDQFEPKSTSEILGNSREITQIKTWLTKFSKPNILSKPTLKKTDFKAILISGPPGIGKTTAAKLCARECNYEFVILNASDSRNKNAVNNFVGALKNNQVLSSTKSPSSLDLHKTVLIMDEVDGMSGDRGGMRALIEQIKNTEIPIICVCNDRQSEKVRSLANYCLDIKFTPPSNDLLAQRLTEIANFVSPNPDMLSSDTLTDIAQKSRGDVRHAISNLQVEFLQQLTGSLANPHSEKDPFSHLSTVNATKQLLASNFTTKMSTLKSLFFSDYNLIPFYVFDHYLNTISQPNDHAHKITQLQNLDTATDCLMKADQLNKLIRTDRDYQLLNIFGMYSSILPLLWTSPHITNVSFPVSLMMISSQNKKLRLLRELKDHFGQSINYSSDYSVLEYSRVLLLIIKNLLQKNDFDELYDLFLKYDLNPDILKENICFLLFKKTDDSPIDDLSKEFKNFTKYFKDRFGDDGIFKIAGKKIRGGTKKATKKEIEVKDKSVANSLADENEWDDEEKSGELGKETAIFEYEDD